MYSEFTLKLKTGKWSITPFWKFFFSKNPKIRRMSGLPKKQNVNKVVRRSLLRGRYSSAMNSLFSSSIAPNDEQTLLALKKLHPVEEFQLSKPEAHSFWSDTPISKNEVDDIISCLPRGKAAGPSKLTFDILKDCTSAQSVISEDLACFFQNLMMLSCKAPLEMSASRLVALSKSGGGVRPIAVGESLFRLLSMLIFKRITNTARTHVSPFQFGIGTIDGASIASLTSELFFLSNQSYYILNLDFKNAFNSVKWSAIFLALQSSFPYLLPFFYHFYGTAAPLVFNEHTLYSTSGVRQGDLMGPFLFCLAIHPVLVALQSRFPNIRIVTYMDDISLIGSPYDLGQAAAFAFHEFESIGLSLNAKKCLLIHLKLFDFLVLNIRLNEIHAELDTISKLDIEKHLKFFILKICYSGKVTHILRSTPPELSIPFAQRFNQLRTEFLAHLLNLDSKFLREHIFCSPDLGGVGFTKSKILSKAALIGSGKNFVFEFSSRFSPDLALLSSNCSPFLLALEHEINTLPLDVWMKCFPIEVQEISVKNLSNLKYAKKKLQHFLVKELKSLDYTNHLCLAKMNNPAFYQFLLDNTDSSASSFFSQIPQIYGLLLNNEEWETFIRLQCYLWPQQLVNGLKCKCDTPVSLTHLFNCQHLVTFRRCLHDNVYKDIYQMAKSFRYRNIS
ncbi:hypothetical protein RCL1_004573 [Eukaryota sp. TZLM3-RCL]